MSYAEFNPVVKKLNLKPKGEVEIVLTTSLSNLRGSVETLSEMIDQKVRISLESTVVTYNVQINARTEKPIRTYKVDESGIVSEVKPEGEQVEMDLGLPKRDDPITVIPEEISREVVDEFILELLAPDFNDLPYPFLFWIQRLSEGESYSRLANEFAMSSGRIVELIDEYRSRVAPLAAKWDEWRNAKAEGKQPDPEPVAPGDGEEGGDEIPPADEGAGDDDIPTDPGEMEFVDEGSGGSQEDEGSESGSANGAEALDIDEIILNEKPVFEDIPYDFPSLLQRRKSGETWMQIASSLGISSSKLSSAWSKYKKRIEENRGNGAA